MRRFCSATLLLLAAACTPMEWTRSDVTPEQAAADSQLCDQQAWQEARWNAAMWGPRYGAFGPWMYRDGFGRPFVGRPFGPFYDPLGDSYMEEQRLANFCMRAKGYELVPVEK